MKKVFGHQQINKQTNMLTYKQIIINDYKGIGESTDWQKSKHPGALTFSNTNNNPRKLK